MPGARQSLQPQGTSLQLHGPWNGDTQTHCTAPDYSTRTLPDITCLHRSALACGQGKARHHPAQFTEPQHPLALGLESSFSNLEMRPSCCVEGAVKDSHHPAQACQPLPVAGRGQRPEGWHQSPGCAPDRQGPSVQRDGAPNTPQGASFPVRTLANLPRVASNPGSAVKTSRAGKSKTSCLNCSWQLMRDSGCRVSMISIWAGEHSPGDGKGVRRVWPGPPGPLHLPAEPEVREREQAAHRPRGERE